jgi:hypothetical protein
MRGMGILGFFKDRPPDLRTLGKWLWNNDVALLQRMLQDGTLALFEDIMTSGVITAACGAEWSEEERATIAGQLIHLLDGRALVKVYDPVTTDSRIRSAAETARNLVMSGEYTELFDESIMLGTLFAIHLWYAKQFSECIVVTNHLLEIPGDGSAEVYRVRGFAHFVLKEYDSALRDLLEARKLRPGLVGLNEPIAALAKITKTPLPAPVEEPDGVRSGRAALLIFSRILWAAAARYESPTVQNNPFHDFRIRAQEVDVMIQSNSIGRRAMNLGDVFDFAKCGISAQMALLRLLSDSKPGEDTIPDADDIRAAFGYSLVFLAGTQSINSLGDPAFAEMVQDFNGAVNSVYAKLDGLKFDLP